MITNEDRVEGIASGDEFHEHVASFVYRYGRGEPVSITWDKHPMLLAGMCVSQLQYGMVAYKFRVIQCSNGYTLHMLRHQESRETDYFEPF